MKASDLIKPIEDFAPIATQETWDNCGFSLGDPNGEVHKALLALDCTEAVMEEAIAEKCDIIITHHPLIFRGIKSITPQNFTGRIIEKGIRHNITVYSAHTNIDKAACGVSELMADKLSLTERVPLSEEGFGILGKLSDGMYAKDLIKLISEKFCLEHIRYSSPLDEPIYDIAVCGGSGKDFIRDAIMKKAQVYITGDITYHDFYCENDFMIIDIGHYGSELGVINLFAKILSKKFPTFAIYIGKENKNPIYYY